MDVFWLIPSGIVAMAFLAVFYAYIRTRPLSPSDPKVLLDKPSDEPLIDPAAMKHDWSNRPCGAFMEWQSERRE